VFTTGAGERLCVAQTDAAGDASCTFALTAKLSAALRRGYRASFAGDSDYLPSSVTVSARRHPAHLLLLSVSAHPVHRHRCQAEMNGQATTASVACNSAILDIRGAVTKTATGSVTVTITGGPPRRHRRLRVTAVIHNGRFRARVQVPGRNFEPGDRWTVTATYGGDAAHDSQSASRQLLLEAEGAGNPLHEKL
jgi:hypothetical protein